MKLIKFNGTAQAKHITLKETHGIPHSGDILVVSDDRALELAGHNSQNLKLAEPIEDVITVKLGKGDWVLDLIKNAEHPKPEQTLDTAELAAESVGEHRGFVVFAEPVDDPEEAEQRADAVLKETTPKKKTTRKKKVEENV